MERYNINDGKTNHSEFNEIIDKIMKNENYTFFGKVIEEIEDKKLGIINMSIVSKEENCCRQFIRKADNKTLKNIVISFEIFDLRIKIIKDTQYFNILKYNIKNESKIKNIKFDKIRIYNSIKEANDNYLSSFILKSKEKFVNLINNNYYFQDYLGNKIEINETNNFNFENNKIYIFNGYIYDKEKNQLKATNISSIEEYYSYNSIIYDLNNAGDIKNIDILDKDNLLCFKGRIHFFNITECYLQLKDSKGNIIKVFVNHHLLQKISINCQCTFINFLKKNKNEYVFTYLSDIEFKEETLIEFNFIKYNVNNIFFNRIKIDDKIIPIDNEKMTIEINDKNEKNIFIKDITYERYDGQRVINTFNFLLEINKGKINTVNSLLLKKEGHCYQFYIQSLKNRDLPKEISIFNDGEEIKLNNPDKYGNEFIERFTIVNVDEQNINDIFPNIKKKDIKNDEYDWKYLVSIKNQKDIDFKKFIKEKQLTKEKFEIEDNIRNELKKLYEKYILDDDTFYSLYGGYEKIFPMFDMDNYELIPPLINKFILGFKGLIFENTKKNFEDVRLISFLTLYFLSNKLKANFPLFLGNYKKLLELIIDLDYIDRIKILLSFTLNIITNINDNNDDKTLPSSTYEWLNFINLDEQKTLKKFQYIKRAYDIFFNIIDGIKEDSPFYKSILQFNGIIYKDVISNKIVHSGAVLNLLDIKLELIKNINRFLFLSYKKHNLYDYSNFNESGLCITINLFSFLTSEEIYDKKYDNKKTVAILFLLFHEIFGHQKKNINNENNLTPRDYYDNNFNDLLVKFNDSGHAFERLLLNKKLNLKYLMRSDLSEKLLDINLYIDTNFNKLQQIYNNIESECENNKTNSNNYEIIKEVDKKYEEFDIKKNIKGKPIDNLDKDKDKKDKSKIILAQKKEEDNLLYRDLFIIYENKTEEELKSLKDDKNFQRFIMLHKNRKKKYSIESIING